MREGKTVKRKHTPALKLRVINYFISSMFLWTCAKRCQITVNPVECSRRVTLKTLQWFSLCLLLHSSPGISWVSPIQKLTRANPALQPRAGNIRLVQGQCKPLGCPRQEVTAVPLRPREGCCVGVPATGQGTPYLAASVDLSPWLCPLVACPL